MESYKSVHVKLPETTEKGARKRQAKDPDDVQAPDSSHIFASCYAILWTIDFAFPPQPLSVIHRQVPWLTCGINKRS